MLAGTAALFYACGDSGSSDANGSDSYTESGSFVVNKEKKTIMAMMEDEETACVNENLEYTWKKINLGVDSNYFKYDFVGDTLVIYQSYSSYDFGLDGDEEIDYSTSGQMFVGGSNGKLDGTWKSTLCSYDSQLKESTCYKPCSEVKTPSEKEIDEMDVEDLEDLMERLSASLFDAYCLDEEDMENHPDITLKISGTSFTKTVKYNMSDDDEYDFDDYTNSRFMTSFLGELFSSDADVPSINKLFREDSSDMENMIEELAKKDITVSSKTKKSISFNVKGKTLSVNIKDVTLADDHGNFSMNVSYDKTNCSLTEEEGAVTKSKCKAEYGEYFEKDTQKDANGNTITIAYGYEKSNIKDFERCTQEIADSLYTLTKPKKEDFEVTGCEDLYEQYDAVCNNSSSYDDIERCSSVQSDYLSCLSNASYDDDDDGEDPVAPSYELYAKKAPAAAKKAKKEFLKNARRLAYKLQRVAD